jgi:hypothetical protein
MSARSKPQTSQRKTPSIDFFRSIQQYVFKGDGVSSVSGRSKKGEAETYTSFSSDWKQDDGRRVAERTSNGLIEYLHDGMIGER